VKRAFAIAGAALMQTARSKAAWVAALALLLAVPVSGWLFADDAATRAWITRLIPVEVLRLLLPLAAITGGAFLIRPGVRAGWAVLPARRSEWFAGKAIAGAVVLIVATVLFAGGAVIAGLTFGEPLSLTTHPEILYAERVRDGKLETARFKGGMALADPQTGETIVADIPRGVGERVAGILEYEPILTGVQPPGQGAPVEVWIDGEGTRQRLEVSIEARRRISFQGERRGAARVIIKPTDPGLAIGTSVSRMRFELGQSAPLASLLGLTALSLGGALLCLFVVLAIRALSTSATAALAGMLLLAALTLLPSLAPTESMARDLRRDLGGEKEQEGVLKALEAELTALPQLFPDRYYDEFLSARVVPGGAVADGLARFGIGLLVLAPGAWLFTRRQISK
jgi:hypothetical protein